MKIKSVIIDDELAGRNTLEKLLELYCPDVWVAAKASNGNEAVQLLNELQPDIAFLDIVMPQMTGFDILEKCRHLQFTPVFVSAHSEYLLKAIKFAAFDFLPKPVSFKELRECIARYSESPQGMQRHKRISAVSSHNLALPTGEGYYFINTSELMYCKADNNYTYFVLADNSRILVCRTLKDCEDLLPSGEFFRSHQSYLVNFAYIKKYLKGINSVVMKNGDEIPVATRKKEEFNKRIGKL